MFGELLAFFVFYVSGFFIWPCLVEFELDLKKLGQERPSLCFGMAFW